MALNGIPSSPPPPPVVPPVGIRPAPEAPVAAERVPAESPIPLMHRAAVRAEAKAVEAAEEARHKAPPVSLEERQRLVLRPREVPLEERKQLVMSLEDVQRLLLVRSPFPEETGRMLDERS